MKTVADGIGRRDEALIRIRSYTVSGQTDDGPLHHTASSIAEAVPTGLGRQGGQRLDEAQRAVIVMGWLR